MNAQLVVVGAHNGSKLADTIERSAAKGPVILIEPVDWLFDQLVKRFKHLKNITFINEALIDKFGINEVAFSAPTPSATTINSIADQLGSLDIDHAENSVAGISDYFERIIVPATTFTALFKDLGVKSIHSLILDSHP
jgi:hypothetical protein